jgi:hypothetical protein
VLPWSSQRSYAWNGDRDLDDPASRWLPRRVVADDALTVGTTSTVLEDPLGRRVAGVATGTAPLLVPLRQQGYAGVLVERDQPGAAALTPRLTGLRLVRRTATLDLYGVPDPDRVPQPQRSIAAPVAGDVVALLLCLGAITSLARIETRRGATVYGS